MGFRKRRRLLSERPLFAAASPSEGLGPSASSANLGWTAPRHTAKSLCLAVDPHVHWEERRALLLWSSRLRQRIDVTTCTVLGFRFWASLAVILVRKKGHLKSGKSFLLMSQRFLAEDA